jgi:hypothetical protein
MRSNLPTNLASFSTITRADSMPILHKNSFNLELLYQKMMLLTLLPIFIGRNYMLLLILSSSMQPTNSIPTHEMKVAGSSPSAYLVYLKKLLSLLLPLFSWSNCHIHLNLFVTIWLNTVSQLTTTTFGFVMLKTTVERWPPFILWFTVKLLLSLYYFETESWLMS